MSNGHFQEENMNERRLNKKEIIKRGFLVAAFVLGTAGTVSTLAHLSVMKEERERVTCLDRGIIDGEGGRGFFYHPGLNLECEKFIRAGKADERKFLIHGR
jgi:hypothetical protein